MMLSDPDDTTAFVSDASSAENLIELLNIFRDVSGLELSKSKTEGMWLGRVDTTPQHPLI